MSMWNAPERDEVYLTPGQAIEANEPSAFRTFDDVPRKVYLFDVTPIKFPLLEEYKYHKNGQELCLVKFGHTHHMDVLKRFDPSVHDNYRKSEKYLDFNFRPVWSCKVNNMQEAKDWEDSWIGDSGMFNKNRQEKVWIEKVLGCPDTNYYREATGITELRLVTKKQRAMILKKLYNWRDEYQSKKGS